MLLRLAIVAALALPVAMAASGPTRRSDVWTPSFVAPPQPIYMVFRDVEIDKFAATVSVGTPPQPVSLMASLAVSDLIVLNHKLETRPYYDHTRSSTYCANGTHVEIPADGEDSLVGVASRDAVTLGQGRELVVHDQLFMELDGPNEIISALPPKVGGVIGLGPRGAASTGTPSIVRTMVNQQLLPQPVVGLHLDPTAMHVTFGGINASHCDERDVTYFAQDTTNTSAWWTVPVAGMNVNGSQVVGNGGRALVIEYFEGVVGPTDEINKLAAAVGADEYHQLPCNGPGPDLTLRFGDSGFAVTLDKKAYTHAPVDTDLCFFAFSDYRHGPIEPLTPGEPWVFGLGLLRHVYTVLDFGTSEDTQRIGFGPLK